MYCKLATQVSYVSNWPPNFYLYTTSDATLWAYLIVFVGFDTVNLTESILHPVALVLKTGTQ